MCRLFGFKGTNPTKLSFLLVDAPNSLARQSALDSRNITNSHGWGIGFYQEHQAHLQKSVKSAFADRNFKFLTNFIEADTMIAHVRDATVGEISDINCHPFRYKNWIMAHNGTIESFQLLKHHILKKIGPELTQHIQGTTDSECFFFLFISNLSKMVNDITSPDIDVTVVKVALISTLLQINKLAEEFDIKTPSKLNTVVTNGHVMAASRHGHTLYFTFKNKGFNEDFKLYKDDVNLKLSFDNLESNIGESYNESVMVASEVLNIRDNWFEVPENTILGVTEDLRVSFYSIH